MLISVFGIWLMAANINVLVPREDGCLVTFNGGTRGLAKFVFETSCSVVAQEINKKVKEGMN